MATNFYAWRTSARGGTAMDGGTENGSNPNGREECRAEKPNECPYHGVGKIAKTDEKHPSTAGSAGQEGEQYDERGFKTLSPEQFVSATTEAKKTCSPEIAWRVDVKSADYYRKECAVMKVSRGGSCYAVKHNGDIISVCKSGNDRNVRGRDLMAAAIADGGTKLDTYDGNYGFYTKCGMKPVSWTPWDEGLAPDDWKDARANGDAVQTENVIFFIKGEASSGMTATEWEQTVPPRENVKDENGNVVQYGYDLAEADRDNAMKQQ